MTFSAYARACTAAFLLLAASALSTTVVGQTYLEDFATHINQLDCEDGVAFELHYTQVERESLTSTNQLYLLQQRGSQYSSETPEGTYIQGDSMLLAVDHDEQIVYVLQEGIPAPEKFELSLAAGPKWAADQYQLIGETELVRTYRFADPTGNIYTLTFSKEERRFSESLMEFSPDTPGNIASIHMKSTLISKQEAGLPVVTDIVQYEGRNLVTAAAYAHYSIVRG